MESGILVALSGQVALQRRLDTLANNMANSATPGYRAENVTFQSVLTNGDVAYSKSGASTYSSSQAALTRTDNPLDIAIQGEGYFSISTPAGAAYTRDGRLTLSPAGVLVTTEGFPLLDAGGNAIQVNPASGAIQVASDGSISQSGSAVGTIGMFRLPPDGQLSRGPGTSFVSRQGALPIADIRKTSVVQGHIEGSNVDPIQEVAKLMTVSRTFEAVSSSIDQSERRMTDAIHVLGSGLK